ncbi:hypothetical protein F6X56_26280 [Rhodococcus erythropolis]|uniref:Uncharacterized protein n=2 Tax=Rhodococcus qingshengii TaxID=334542 RepID=A0AAW6LUR7_RHOSG|nr:MULTISPECIES: hypothetical protein [Rhodococcus]MBT2273673.1 hypothetical protein [Rhodococcus qingshengii]MBX9147764.1 hypothetical protein [Rhodococcus qingshengii]MCJ0944661.1 hypothetical protein [Rhodococcus sp. ARC_M8]MCX6475958.1 hypothetical protein [Rhodococcus sp. (in: high G+C Gram-positive bacteria)]MCZ4546891.1 hypothetical protein [Rhodococcus qingshengii]
MRAPVQHLEWTRVEVAVHMKISKKVALVVVAACAVTLGSAQVGTARADAPVKVSVAGHVVSAGHFEQVRRPNRCVKAGTGKSKPSEQKSTNRSGRRGSGGCF